MSDGNRIVQDPDPAKPRDVETNQSADPAQPHDVTVRVDLDPAAPHDVPITLDPEPTQPHDVAVQLDGPPAGTFDVPTTIDPAPAAPHDVPTALDPGPAAPHDVTVTVDPVPDLPFDVPTPADPDPAAPFDVPTPPDSDPIEPFDVEVSPSPDPIDPADVPTPLDPDPAGTFDVPTPPDPDPAEIVDVPVALDPDPAGTFDVPVTADPDPAAPFDVPTPTDPDPVVPYDVPIDFDPEPRAPRNVSTVADPAPADPVDVPTPQDPDPADPFDVPTPTDPDPADSFDVPTPTDPDPAVPTDVPTPVDPDPASPFDVPTPQDPDPVDPVDVPTPADPDPSVPFDVPTPLDPPPGPTIDVPITYDSAPAEPFDVPTFPDPQLLDGNIFQTPTIEGIIALVEKYDSTLATFLGDTLDISPISINGPGGGALDPTNLIAWFNSYVNSVGLPGVARFIAEQTVLYGMNPVVARVFDPSYFAKMLIPGSMGTTHTTIDTMAGVTLQAVALVNDLSVVSKASANPNNPAGDQDVYGPARTPTAHPNATTAQDFSVGEMVDAAADGTDHPFMTLDTGLNVKRFDASKYFDARDSFGAVTAARARARQQSEDVVTQVDESKLAASAFIDGVIPTAFKGEDPDGAVYSVTPDPSVSNIDDDDARVPLCFTDLRKDPSRNMYRSIYFRPLNMSFSTALSPEYQENAAFGRVDPTVAYMRTSRTVSLSFEVHAFAPEDIRTMYQKLVWLESLCYPSYTPESLFQSGPVTRLRVGDVLATSRGGIPGVIRSLNVDYAEALWELKRGMKVPMSFKVQLDFLCLHDGPVGLLNGQFGTFQLPPPGAGVGKDTNNPGGPTDSRDNTVAPTGPSIIPGGFARFGEPVRKG